MNAFDNFLKRTLDSSTYQVLPLAGDASSRRYFRIVAHNDTYVLMVWEPFKDDGNYPFLSVLDHFHSCSVAVPKVFAKSPDEGLVLLEDLGDLTLERKFWENQDQSLVIPYYKQALDELIKMHFYATHKRSNATCFKIEFDVERLLWEMNYGREHLLLKLCNFKFSDVETKAIDQVFRSVCERLHQQTKYVAHRDYHSRNVMLKLGRARIIDFQDARLGPIQYDLVSLLRDSYVDLSKDSVDVLLEYYLQKRNELPNDMKLPKISRDEFNEIFEIQTIQRCFKACGSFASFFNLRGDTRYLKYLKNTLVRVQMAGSVFKEYKPWVDILDDQGLFDLEFDDFTETR